MTLTAQSYPLPHPHQCSGAKMVTAASYDWGSGRDFLWENLFPDLGEQNGWVIFGGSHAGASCKLSGILGPNSANEVGCTPVLPRSYKTFWGATWKLQGIMGCNVVSMADEVGCRGKSWTSSDLACAIIIVENPEVSVTMEEWSVLKSTTLTPQPCPTKTKQQGNQH